MQPFWQSAHEERLLSCGTTVLSPPNHTQDDGGSVELGEGVGTGGGEAAEGCTILRQAPVS